MLEKKHLDRDAVALIQPAFENHLQKFFLARRERYDYGEFFLPLYMDLAEFVSRKAKRIRPVLFLSALDLFSETPIKNFSAAMDAATAIELLHSFILIHDDIIDQSEKRRGLPTFHKLMEARMANRPNKARIGQNMALVMGDIVFSFATETLLESDFHPTQARAALRKFLSYVADTGCGEIQDIMLGTRDISCVSTDEIEHMYAHKTTRYTIECPLVLGAILGGAPCESVETIQRFSEPIGLAFQIQNDLQEFKHFDISDLMFQSDLLEGKKTLLVRAAFDSLGETDRSFLRLCLNSPSHGESYIHKLRELILKSGAETVLQQRVRDLFKQAEACLANSSLKDGQKNGLLLLIQYIQQQSHA